MSAYSFDEPPFDDNEVERMRVEMAQGEWDDATEERWEWVRENIHHYAEQILMGGEQYNAALHRMEQDFIYHKAAMYPDSEVYENLRGEGVTIQEAA